MYRHHIAARRAPLFCEEDWHLTHGCKMTIWCVHISVLMTPVWRDLKRKGTMSPFFFLQHFLDGGFNVLCFPSLISKNAMITPIDEVLGGWGFCCWKIPFRGPLELRSLDYWCGSPVDGPTQIFFAKHGRTSWPKHENMINLIIIFPQKTVPIRSSGGIAHLKRQTQRTCRAAAS